jgi:hypothetical protein
MAVDPPLFVPVSVTFRERPHGAMVTWFDSPANVQ